MYQKLKSYPGRSGHKTCSLRTCPPWNKVACRKCQLKTYGAMNFYLWYGSEMQNLQLYLLHPLAGVHLPLLSAETRKYCEFLCPFSSCPQSLPASESFPMCQLFAWGGQSTGVSPASSPLFRGPWLHDFSSSTLWVWFLFKGFCWRLTIMIYGCWIWHREDSL